jgi:hypothetical protein
MAEDLSAWALTTDDFAGAFPSCTAKCSRMQPTTGNVPESIKISYTIAITHCFYKLQPLRTLEDIRADILAVEKENEELFCEIIGGRGR